MLNFNRTLATIYTTIVMLVFGTIAPGYAAKPTDIATGAVIMSTMKQNKFGKPAVQGRVLIKAPPAVVWETVHHERNHDPDIAYSKVLEKNQNHSVLEQKLVLIPVIGSAICVMSNDEVPLERIDYKLIKSDRHFKAMEGSWILTSTDQGRATILELNSHLALSFPVPRKFLDGISSSKVQKRLQRIQKMAETQHRLAESQQNL